jgi:hypothetical protein
MNPDRIARHAAWVKDLNVDSSDDCSIDYEEVVEVFQDLLTSSDESSDLDDDELATTRGGSKPGKRANIARGREEGHCRLWADYFAEEPTYDESHFRRRFRMPYGARLGIILFGTDPIRSRNVFLRILAGVTEVDDYFVQKPDRCGVKGLSSLQVDGPAGSCSAI